MTGYGVMILAMTATPLAVTHHNHDLTATSTVIQLHVLGMFLPSFFTGSLIARFGVLQVMPAGVVLLTTHVLLALTGTGFYNFAAALIVLGVAPPRAHETPPHLAIDWLERPRWRRLSPTKHARFLAFSLQPANS